MRGKPTSDPSSRIHKPGLDEMGIVTWQEVKPDRDKRAGPRKPTLDEMGPGTESRIWQLTSSREAGPEFRSTPRSSGGGAGASGRVEEAVTINMCCGSQEITTTNDVDKLDVGHS